MPPISIHTIQLLGFIAGNLEQKSQIKCRSDRPSVRLDPPPRSPHISGAFDSCGGEIDGVLLLHGFSLRSLVVSPIPSPLPSSSFPPLSMLFPVPLLLLPLPFVLFYLPGAKKRGGGEKQGWLCARPFPPFLHFPRRERKRSGGG